jgi:hypothetical protein
VLEPDVEKMKIRIALASIVLASAIAQGTPTPTPAAKHKATAAKEATPAERKSRVLQQQGRSPAKTETPGNAREVALGGPDTADRQQQGLTPTPNATGTEKNRQMSKSVIQNMKARERATVTPTPATNKSINLNSSRSNRVVQPSPTPKS